MLIDLQLHSTYSDGYLTPSKLAKFIASQGIKVAALTDHNTVGGLSEFREACRAHGIKFIPGLELYVKLGSKRFNLLWYNFEKNSPELHKLLRSSQIRRRQQMRVILEKLTRLGLRIDVNRLLDKYNHYVPINHIIDEIKADKNNLAKFRKKLGFKNPPEGEIIREYFKNKNIGRLRNSYIDFKRILKLRKKIGGQLVLCHPGKNHNIKKEYWAKLKKLGLDGVELMSPHHPWNTMMYMQYLSRELDLIETGGSDFHRFEGDNEPLQYSWEYYRIEAENLRKIEKIIG